MMSPNAREEMLRQRKLEAAILHHIRKALALATERFDEEYAFDYVTGTTELLQVEYRDQHPRPQGSSRQKISHSLQKKVFERDAYRCVKCGSWRELCADHIYPQSLGGPTKLDNLQTLCRPCNTAKGAKVESHEQPR